MQRLSNLLNRLCLGVGTVMLVAMTAMVVVQIIGRYVLATPPSWTEEAARYLLVWLSFLGATCAFHDRLDPKLTIGKGPDSTRKGKLLGAGRIVAVLLFVGPWLVFAPGFLQRHWFRTSDSLEINSALLVAIVPLSGAIILVHLAAQCLDPRSGSERDKRDQEGRPL